MHWTHPVRGFKMRNTSAMKDGQWFSGTPARTTLLHSQTQCLGRSPELKKVSASIVKVKPLRQIHDDEFGMGGDFGRLNGRKVCADYTGTEISISYFNDPLSWACADVNCLGISGGINNRFNTNLRGVLDYRHMDVSPKEHIESCMKMAQSLCLRIIVRKRIRIIGTSMVSEHQL